jgi:hypothetical protein
VLVRDELRDNHHVRQRISVDPEGCLNGSEPLKCAGQRGAFIASGEEAVGSNPATPDTKVPGQRQFAIESRWPRVSNCVTMGSRLGRASLALTLS